MCKLQHSTVGSVTSLVEFTALQIRFKDLQCWDLQTRALLNSVKMRTLYPDSDRDLGSSGEQCFGDCPTETLVICYPCNESFLPYKGIKSG